MGTIMAPMTVKTAAMAQMMVPEEAANLEVLEMVTDMVHMMAKTAAMAQRIAKMVCMVLMMEAEEAANLEVPKIVMVMVLMMARMVVMAQRMAKMVSMVLMIVAEEEANLEVLGTAMDMVLMMAKMVATVQRIVMMVFMVPMTVAEEEASLEVPGMVMDMALMMARMVCMAPMMEVEGAADLQTETALIQMMAKMVFMDQAIEREVVWVPGMEMNMMMSMAQEEERDQEEILTEGQDPPVIGMVPVEEEEALTLMMAMALTAEREAGEMTKMEGEGLGAPLMVVLMILTDMIQTAELEVWQTGLSLKMVEKDPAHLQDHPMMVKMASTDLVQVLAMERMDCMVQMIAEGAVKWAEVEMVMVQMVREDLEAAMVLMTVPTLTEQAILEMVMTVQDLEACMDRSQENQATGMERMALEQMTNPVTMTVPMVQAVEGSVMMVVDAPPADKGERGQVVQSPTQSLVVLM